MPTGLGQMRQAMQYYGGKKRRMASYDAPYQDPNEYGGYNPYAQPDPSYIPNMKAPSMWERPEYEDYPNPQLPFAVFQQPYVGPGPGQAAWPMLPDEMPWWYRFMPWMSGMRPPAQRPTTY